MPRPPAKIENFRNRVVGSGVERVDQLVANPNNFRVHPDSQQQALAGAIDEIGFARSILVNRTTGNVIDGHARITIAMRSGVEELPVEYVELSEDEEKKALLFLDPISAMAASDKAKLDELMQQVQSDDERVQDMLRDLARTEGLSSSFMPNNTPDFSQREIDDDDIISGDSIENKRKNLIEVICPNCGTVFYIDPSANQSYGLQKN